MEKIVAVILMAGFSLRFGGETNKQLCLLKGKPVFSYSINEFSKCKSISKLILVVNENNKKEIEKYTKSMGISANFVLGGETRQESVRNALESLKDEHFDYILIHDGARPLVSLENIKDVINATKEIGAATTYIESNNTLAIRDNNSYIKDFANRDEIVQIQTPQGFDFDLLKEAHKKYLGNDATDDCSLLFKLNKKIKLVKGSKKLHKITTKEDIKYLKGLVDERL